MEKTYKISLFDLDNTLVDDDENRKYALRCILSERNEAITNEKIESFLNHDNQFWKDRSEGKIKDPYKFKSIDEKTKWVRAQRFITYFGDISFEEAVEINRKYTNYLRDHIVPIKNSQEILNYLYEKHYKIFIITNGPKIAVNEKLRKIGAQKYITGIVTAEETGYMKPHEEYFRVLFEKIGSYEKKDMIIIGDELEKDILGAIKNGIDSCWVNIKRIKNNTEYKPSYEIHDLIELKNIL